MRNFSASVSKADMQRLLFALEIHKILESKEEFLQEPAFFSRQQSKSELFNSTAITTIMEKNHDRP